MKERKLGYDWVALNLGSSDDRRPGYINVDFAPPCDKVVDLRKKWPWPDSSVDAILAKDIFEHIENEEFRGQRGIIWCMNEAHRVLKPGGELELIVPCLPGAKVIKLDGQVGPPSASGVAPWADPTHVSVWTADTRYYFDERWNNPRDERGRLGNNPSYGITALFRTVGGQSGENWTPIEYASDALDRHKIMVILEAVK